MNRDSNLLANIIGLSIVLSAARRYTSSATIGPSLMLYVIIVNLFYSLLVVIYNNPYCNG